MPDSPSVSPAESESLSATRTLLLIVGFSIFIVWLSGALLIASSSFWSYCREHAAGVPMAGLRIEADLRLPEPGSLKAVIAGASLAETNISNSTVAKALGGETEQVLRVGMPGATMVEVAMLAPLLQRLHPRLVIVPVSDLVLLPDIARRQWRLYDPRVAGEIFNFAEILADHDQQASGLLSFAHPVIRHRDALRRLFFPGAFVEERVSKVVKDRQKRAEKAKRHKADDDKDRKRCDSVNVRALGVLAARVRSAGGSLVVALTPSRADVLEPSRMQAAIDCLRARAATDGYDFVSIDGLSMGREHFRDSVHFTSAGTRIFTLHLLPAIRRVDRAMAK